MPLAFYFTLTMGAIGATLAPVLQVLLGKPFFSPIIDIAFTTISTTLACSIIIFIKKNMRKHYPVTSKFATLYIDGVQYNTQSTLTNDQAHHTQNQTSNNSKKTIKYRKSLLTLNKAIDELINSSKSINDFAEKINLIALDTAIEIARSDSTDKNLTRIATEITNLTTKLRLSEQETITILVDAKSLSRQIQESNKKIHKTTLSTSHNQGKENQEIIEIISKTITHEQQKQREIGDVLARKVEIVENEISLLSPVDTAATNQLKDLTKHLNSLALQFVK